MPLLAGRWVTGVLAFLAALSLATSLSNADAASARTGAANVALKVADIHGVPVLTDARGDTLYWFAPDSPTASHCYGTCAAYWPPVVGTLAPSTGIVGSFATLKRSDGATQGTYNGHPLYTYVGDTAPGLANGNRIDLNGGWWYEMKVTA